MLLTALGCVLGSGVDLLFYACFSELRTNSY
jgi:hypothetical protein